MVNYWKLISSKQLKKSVPASENTYFILAWVSSMSSSLKRRKPQ